MNEKNLLIIINKNRKNAMQYCLFLNCYNRRKSNKTTLLKHVIAEAIANMAKRFAWLQIQITSEFDGHYNPAFVLACNGIFISRFAIACLSFSIEFPLFLRQRKNTENVKKIDIFEATENKSSICSICSKHSPKISAYMPS